MKTAPERCISLFLYLPLNAAIAALWLCVSAKLLF